MYVCIFTSSSSSINTRSDFNYKKGRERDEMRCNFCVYVYMNICPIKKVLANNNYYYLQQSF